jgi:hypothetical protein
MNPNEFELARLRRNELLREAEDGRLKNRPRAPRRKRKESRLLSPPESSPTETDLRQTDLERCAKP